MSPSRWREVKEIVADALELPAEQRAEHIGRACSTDPQLKEQVERLVAAGSNAETGPLDRRVQIDLKNAPSLRPDTLLSGRFRIVGFLARGGMGEVYRVHDEELDEDVALKIISEEIADRPGMVERFRYEVQRARRITHANVCRIHDLDSDRRPDGTVLRFLTMQLIEGPTLAKVMQAGGISGFEALALLGDVLAGLEAAHQAGIAHCDLKPNNVLLDRVDGERARAVITDFGLARVLRAEGSGDSTRTGVVGGAPAYMAPELRFGWRGGVAGDVFAFGVMAYELLTGSHPFDCQPSWEMEPGFRAAPPRSLSPDIPQEWDAAILRCLEFEPAARFATVAELRSALGAGAAAPKPWFHAVVSRRGLGYAAAGLVVTFGGVAGYRRWFAGRDAIAVLPFENASKDDSLDYLSEGITESLINSLSQLPRLSVPAAGLVRRFKGVANPAKAGNALNASAVLTGALRRREGLLTVEVELIDVATGKQIWGKQYTLTWTSILDVQESICGGILSGLQIRIGDRETKTLRRGLTTDDEAFQLYLRGQYLLGLRRVETLAKSRELFQQAVDRDPKFALAHAGLASSQLLLGYFGAESPATTMAAARASAQKALALEPAVPEAHTVMGAVEAMFDWNWKGAEASFQKAIALKENLAEAHHWYARFVLGPLGRHYESVAEMKRALNWDPYAPILHTNLGVELYFARRFDDAISQLQKVVEMDPRFNLPYWTLGQAWAAKGNLSKAVESLEIARQLEPGAKPDLVLAYCYAVFGKMAEARTLRDETVRKYRRPSYAASELAYVESALHESEAAIGSLKIALEEREPQLIQVGSDPKFDWIRDNPEFSNILRSIGLNPGVYHYARIPGLVQKELS
ncbi:MAG: protein kinase [Bryobacteraceae bacterium]|jgi:serine/threonine-protein kinase